MGVWAFSGFVIGLIAMVIVPALFGDHSYVVRSGSMEPLINTGDVVIDQTIRPLDVHIGDTVTFRDPDNQHRLITHRVQSVAVHQTEATFTTIGVANTVPEQWKIATNGRLGRVAYRIPKIGWLIAKVNTPVGALASVALPALLLAALALHRIWRTDAPTEIPGLSEHAYRRPDPHMPELKCNPERM